MTHDRCYTHSQDDIFKITHTDDKSVDTPSIWLQQHTINPKHDQRDTHNQYNTQQRTNRSARAQVPIQIDDSSTESISNTQ